MKVAKAQSGKATKYLCACVPMVLCAFQIELDLELNLKNKANFKLGKINLSSLKIA
jgi:hypothetical protein